MIHLFVVVVEIMVWKLYCCSALFCPLGLTCVTFMEPRWGYVLGAISDHRESGREFSADEWSLERVQASRRRNTVPRGRVQWRRVLQVSWMVWECLRSFSVIRRSFTIFTVQCAFLSLIWWVFDDSYHFLPLTPSSLHLQSLRFLHRIKRNGAFICCSTIVPPDRKGLINGHAPLGTHLAPGSGEYAICYIYIYIIIMIIIIIIYW